MTRKEFLWLEAVVAFVTIAAMVATIVASYKAITSAVAAKHTLDEQTRIANTTDSADNSIVRISRQQAKAAERGADAAERGAAAAERGADAAERSAKASEQVAQFAAHH